jgi:hypothetical protein
MRAPILSALLLLTSCGRQVEQRGILPEAIPYVMEHVRISALYGAPVGTAGLTVAFLPGLLAQDIAGECDKFNGWPTVYIDPVFWADATDTAKQILIHHELGHCLHDMPHRGDLDLNGYQTSIMYRILLPDFFYEEYKDAYDRELITGVWVQPQ